MAYAAPCTASRDKNCDFLISFYLGNKREPYSYTGILIGTYTLNGAISNDLE